MTLREQHRLGWCFGWMALLLVVSGCSSMRAISARRTLIKAKADTLIHDRLPEQVFTASRELMFERGFTVEDSVLSSNGLEAYFSSLAASSSALEKTPRWGAKDALSTLQYHVQVLPAGEGKSRVIFTRQEQRKVNARVQNIQDRDPELEFELFQRLEPEKAAALEAELERRVSESAK